MELLKEMLQKPSISGFEKNLQEFLLKRFIDAGLDTNVSPLGNIEARKIGKYPFTILLDAHYDQIGMVVKKIEDNGFIRVHNIGGIDPNVIPGGRYTILGKEEVPAIAATKPPHLMLPGERDKPIPLRDILLDPAMTRKELLKVIDIGDPIFFAFEPFAAGDFLVGPGIDNKGGLWILLEIAEFLKNFDPVPTVIFRSTVQEEVGIRGASTDANDIIDLAIVIDATFAKQKGADEDRTFPSDTLALMFGPNYSRKYNQQLEKLAEEHSIKCVREIEESVNGTNAYQYSISGNHATVGISFPVYSMHSPGEAVRMDVLKRISDLIKYFIQDFKGGQ